jgi:pyruvate dehydrogenase E2 component (dihydrolipoamide acetyltransferase)
MADIREVKVPDIGNYRNVPVIEILVQPGDRVSKDQGLVTLESDKATMEVPATAAGVVREVKVKLGDELSEGSVVALIEVGEDTAVPTPTPQRSGAPPVTTAPAPRVTPPAASTPLPAPSPAPTPVAAASGANKLPYASPAVRRFARELGVDLARVTGTGRKGRITRDDVQAFVKQTLAAGAPAATESGLQLLPWPSVDFAKFGEVEPRPLSKIKKSSGANLARNWVRIPHVTQHDLADITELEALRVALNREHEKSGIKFTLLGFLIKAVVAALQKYPEFNASLDAGGENLILKKYFHIGFAADTPNGLVVPVVRDADRKGIIEIAKETAALASKAREGKLTPGEMSGGCFSISSLGGIGGTAFTPIINAPEVAILGVSKASIQPKWDGTAFQPRLLLPLSLSYDHRVIDGAAAARFTSYLAQLLGDMRRCLL